MSGSHRPLRRPRRRSRMVVVVAAAVVGVVVAVARRSRPRSGGRIVSIIAICLSPRHPQSCAFFTRLCRDYLGRMCFVLCNLCAVQKRARVGVCVCVSPHLCLFSISLFSHRQAASRQQTSRLRLNVELRWAVRDSRPGQSRSTP